MWSRLRQATLYFLVGFVIAFVVYLFVEFEADAVVRGIAIAAVIGLLFAALILYLEHRFPDRPSTDA